MDTSVDMKLLKQTKFPQEFNQKVDMQKVNKEVMKKWTAGKISEILGGDDDVVIELCSNLLEQERFPSIKKIQIQLTGFLDKDAGSFCKELWALCLSAQTNPQGVPKELLEAKKLELIQEKTEYGVLKRPLRNRVLTVYANENAVKGVAAAGIDSSAVAVLQGVRDLVPLTTTENETGRQSHHLEGTRDRRREDTMIQG
ncbi:MAG: Serine/arginine repetitive matrix protein 1 [Chrysothrix sp. TS-e1954]|nr:MAG: Serine/arginine repetitive matrix protein 1 [Chrysothrix sp. TS-e1954]